MFLPEVYAERRRKLRKSMSSGIILFLGHHEAPMNYPANTYRFRQDSNFLYFFGLRDACLAGVIDLDEDTDCLYGAGSDIEDIIWSGAQASLPERAARVGVKSALPIRDLRNKMMSAIRKGRKIHFLPLYRGENKIQLSELLGIAIGDIHNYVSHALVKAVIALRSEKDAYEIAEMENACNAGYLMHIAAMQACRPGVAEHTVAGLVEGVALAHNGQVSFPIILSQNSQILHNHNHDAVLETGRLMLTDAGAETAMGYASDFTRTIPVGGKFTDKQRDIYNIVLAANHRAIEKIKPAVPYFNVHLEAARVIAAGLKDLGLIKGDVDEAVKNGAHALFFPHGLGHMLGLDVHDMEDLGENNVGYDDEVQRSDQFGTAYLRLGKRLRKNYVITVEPGIYFIPALIEKWENERINHSFINFAKVREYLDFGGIRLEDDVLVTDKGCRLLGKRRIPITTDEVEDMMSN